MTTLTIATSRAAAPDTVPAQMAAPSLSAGNGSLTITLAADPSDGGSAITSRDVRFSLAGQNNWSVVSGITSPYNLTGLDLLAAYDVQARAVNAIGAGDWSASATETTLSPGPSSGTVDIAIIKRSSQEVAPEGIWFEARVTDANVVENLTAGQYDASFHRVVYVWDFGQGAVNVTKGSNVMDTHKNLNEGGGKQVMNVFATPGTYTVTCSAYNQDDGSLIGTDTQSVTIKDPDTEWPGNRTICVSNASNFTGAPSGAQQVTNLAAAKTALEALGQTGRILLRNGENHTVTSLPDIDNSADNFYLGGFGSGNPGTISTNGNGMFDVNSSRDCVITGGFTFDGGWDSTTEAGTHNLEGQHFIRRKGGVGGNSYILAHDVTATGFGQCIAGNGQTNNVASCLILSDTLITNWGQYGVYIGGTAEGLIAIRGCGIQQDEQAMRGGFGSRGNGRANEEGPIRIINAYRVIIDASDIFSCNDFNQLNSSAPKYPGCQAAIRIHTSLNDSDANNAPRAIIRRCTVEGGNPCISGVRHLNTLTIRPTNTLIEQNYLVSFYGGERFLKWQYAGTTVRNNICVKPDMPFLSGRPREWFEFDRQGTDHSANFPIECYSNTLVVRTNTVDDKGFGINYIDNEFSNFTEANNVKHAPNNTGQQSEVPNLSAGSLATVAHSTWQAHWKGAKWNNYGDLPNGFQTMQTGPQYTTPNDTVRDYRPNSGSPLINDASGLAALQDFFGTIRPASVGNRDRGAVEAA